MLGRKLCNGTGYVPLRQPAVLCCAAQVEPGSIWVFEQPQSLGFSNVTTNVRMTVVKLKSGGLWVHAPVAPTRECLHLLKVGAACSGVAQPPLGGRGGAG